MGTVSIDLNSYKSKLESLSKMVDELSKFTWDNKTAVEYCEKVGIKVSNIVAANSGVPKKTIFSFILSPKVLYTYDNSFLSIL